VLNSDRLIARVQELTEQLEGVHDFQARAVADELVSSIIQLYGEGLERIFAALDDELRDRLAQDGVVASLMLIHGLYPIDLETRVREALESVRPYMESHGGDVELLAVENGVARMRLVGHCESCPASESTLELAIKKALEETAPDLDGLEVEGVTQREFDLPIVQSNNGASSKEWTDLAGELPTPGLTAPTIVAGADVLVANVGGTLLAYRNACGWCRARLDSAPMTPGGLLTCPSCERRFELRRAGRSPDDDVLQIAPVPLLRGEGRVRVAVA
jgi:Fe-S cluster biogenesis protein NfuA/nitrite reductase/ring-hydroxylating ferredoxin subunit